MMEFDFDDDDLHEGPEKSLSTFSDLFVGVSFIFLFLYTVSSIHLSLSEINSVLERKNELSKLRNEYEEKLKLMKNRYGTLLSQIAEQNEDYLDKHATNEDKKLYSEVLKKLSVLEESKREERSKLLQSAKILKRKIDNLDRLHFLVGSFMHSNLYLKNKVVGLKSEMEKEKSDFNKIKGIKEEDIKKKEAFISELTQSLTETEKKSVKELDANKKYFKSVVNNLKDEIKSHESKINLLARERQNLVKEYEFMKKEKDNLQNKLADSNKNIKLLENEFIKEKMELKKQMEQSISEKSRAIASLNNEKSGLQKILTTKQNQLNEKQDQLKHKQGLLDKKLGELEQMKKAPKRSDSFYDGLRKTFIDRLIENFRKAGIKAEVDVITGEVILSGKEFYFEIDEFLLDYIKQEALKRLIPVYAKSLFEDEKTAKYIKSVEIIGYSSPTYAGQFVNPRNMDIKTQSAINYNLELSYKRARSVFRYIFNPAKYFKYKHQKPMFIRTKVTSRSYLEAVKGRLPAAQDFYHTHEYCKKFGCKKQQKVIMKFVLANGK